MTPVPSLGDLLESPAAENGAERAHRRRQRLIQELTVRGSVASAIFAFSEVFQFFTGAPVSPFIRAAALAALLMNGPYYLAATTGRQPRGQAYARMLVDVG
ncbi:MAG: hypothetical protein HY728_02130, partial [Candidatus Rokubacteria bacterium]|nr:hypothetical protein [Candidatus Rokubacteria bacterium]